VSEHPSVEAARRGFESFRGGDGTVLLELFQPDAVWHVPGTNAMAGDYCGLEEIVPFLRRSRELTNGTYDVELLWAVGDDEHLVAVYRARGERPGREPLDIEQALLIELREGLWSEIRAQPLDQAAFDAFWA
jgi:hypothetical protein